MCQKLGLKVVKPAKGKKQIEEANEILRATICHVNGGHLGLSTAEWLLRTTNAGSPEEKLIRIESAVFQAKRLYPEAAASFTLLESYARAMTMSGITTKNGDEFDEVQLKEKTKVDYCPLCVMVVQKNDPTRQDLGGVIIHRHCPARALVNVRRALKVTALTPVMHQSSPPASHRPSL